MVEIQRVDQRQSQPANPEWFTGTVMLSTLHAVALPSRVAVVEVTFAPGARTAWHTHPLGQTLMITRGRGWVQRWGEAIQEVLPGDVVWFSPGEKHWHGATESEEMVHLAIHEAIDGKTADWLEPVSDEQYGVR